MGCKSKKLAESGSIPDRSDDEILELLANNNIEWEWYSIKGGIKVKHESEQFSGTSYFRMRKDSITWALVKRFGFEGGRALITNDDMKVINRIDRTYTIKNTYSLLDQFEVDFSFRDLQEFIVGNVILPRGDYQIKRNEDSYQLNFIDEGIQVMYIINAYTLNVRQSRMYKSDQDYLQIDYENYERSDIGHAYAKDRQIAVYRNARLTEEVHMRVKDIVYNQKVNTPFKIPKNYEEVY